MGQERKRERSPYENRRLRPPVAYVTILATLAVEYVNYYCFAAMNAVILELVKLLDISYIST